jgi:hypothetical protein
MPRIWVCIVATTIACGKGDKTDKGGTTGDKPAAASKLDLVQVDDDKLVAQTKAFARPYGFVWVTAHGTEAVFLADVPPPWDGEMPAGERKRVDNVRDLLRVLDPMNAELEPPPGTDRDDPPPPPPPEDKPDDGADESGGTGTAMVLEEGKMGKQDSDRVEGQYKMKKMAEDPQLARQQAIEQARSAGILGSKALRHGGGFASLGEASIDTAPLAQLQFPAVIVAPSPGAPAIAIPKVLVQAHGGALAVANHDKLALLAVGYGDSPRARVAVESPEGWIELHVAADGVHVVDTGKVVQTVVAWKGAALDRAGLTAALGGKDASDVLVGEGPTAQQLVDTLVALGGKHARLGVLVGTSEARLETLKKSAPPMLSAGQPSTNGDLDKAIIRRFVKRNLDKIQYCYEKALLAKPGLKGTVMVQFFIAPTGTVPSAHATGVDDAVATCVEGVIKGIAFPEPKGGGGVQVNYPFTFRSAAAP